MKKHLLGIGKWVSKLFRRNMVLSSDKATATATKKEVPEPEKKNVGRPYRGWDNI